MTIILLALVLAGGVYAIVFSGGKKPAVSCAGFDRCRSILRTSSLSSEPGIKIYEKPVEYIIEADLRGVDRKSIRVEVQGMQLVISGERRQTAETKEKGLYGQRMKYGVLSRSFPLPEDANIRQISSRYRNGALIVTIPKRSTPDRHVPPSVSIPVR